MDKLTKKVKEKGIVDKIASYIAEPMKITKILSEDGFRSIVEKKIKKKDYPNLYKMKKSSYYDDFKFFVSDMQRLPYYKNKMMDLNTFMNSLEKLAGIKNLYEYGEISDKIAGDEKQMLKTFKKMGFKTYKQKGGKKYKKKKGGIKKKPKQKGGSPKTVDNIEDFVDRLYIEDYEYDSDTDYGLNLYDNIVMKEKGFDICRGGIDKSFIKKTFEDRSMKGYIAFKNDDDDLSSPVGFIIYKKTNKILDVQLLCTKKVKGIPIGQVLIHKMEKYARKNNFVRVRLEAVDTAVSFYKKVGFKVIGSKGKRTLMEKQLVKQENIPKKQTPKSKKRTQKNKKRGILSRLFGR